MDLLAAAERGDRDAVQTLLNSENLNSQDSYGQTLLSKAAENGHKDVVELLLAQDGIALDPKDFINETPLLKAARYGHKDVVELLLAKDGIELNASNEWSRTPLSWAAENGHKDIVELLLAQDGIALDPKDFVNETPLLKAARNGHKDVVELLLAKDGIELNASDKYGQTPLSWAAGNGHKDVVELLLAKDGIESNAADSCNRTPLFWAATNGYKDVVKLLLTKDGIELNAADSYNWTPLSWAIAKGQTDIVKLLLPKSNINLKSRDSHGRTPLSWAAKSGCKDVIELLVLRDDVDLNPKDETGWTPLSWAIAKGHTDVVKLLLPKGNVDLNSKDRNNQTLLSCIAKTKNLDLIEPLLAKQCVICPGRTPLSWTAEVGHDAVVQLLLTKDSTDPNFKDSDGRTPLSRAAENGHDAAVRSLLTKDGTDPNVRDSDSRTPLSRAAENGHEAVVKSLLGKNGANPNIKEREWRNEEEMKLVLARNGADPNSKDSDGRTPLSWAIENGHKAIVKLLLPIDTVTLLLMVQEGKQMAIKSLFLAGSNLDKGNESGQTPLHIAVSSGRWDIAKDLMSYGADINIEDGDGVTPLRLAIRKQNDLLVRELLRRKASTKGIMAKEWRDAYGKGSKDIVLLSETIDGEKRVGFITAFPTAEELSQTSATIDKHLYSFDSEDLLWPKVPITGSKEQLKPNELRIRIPKKTDTNILDISISLRLSIKQYLSHNPSGIPDDGICRIAWKIIRPTNPGDPWISTVYFSTLPYGWIPDDGLDFFEQFIIYTKENWLKLCQQLEKHLSNRRLDQLKCKGKNPDMIDLLANDARNLAQLRSILHGQVREAETFVAEYCRHYNANQVPKGLSGLLTNEFELFVNKWIGQLDQTVRDLLQIEFAWTSINETRISTRLGQNVMLLTYVSIFYLPLGFCAALWAIPDITESGTRNPFIITSIIVGLITLLVTFNMETIAGTIQRVLQYGKDADKSNQEKRREEMRDINSAPRTLLGEYFVELMAALTGKKQRNKQKESKMDGGDAC